MGALTSRKMRRFKVAMLTRFIMNLHMLMRSSLRLILQESELVKTHNHLKDDVQAADYSFGKGSLMQHDLSTHQPPSTLHDMLLPGALRFLQVLQTPRFLVNRRAILPRWVHFPSRPLSAQQNPLIVLPALLALRTTPARSLLICLQT